MSKEGTRQSRYNKDNTKLLSIRLNKKTDQDILYRLDEVDSMAGYIKDLIREDIERYRIENEGSRL